MIEYFKAIFVAIMIYAMGALLYYSGYCNGQSNVRARMSVIAIGVHHETELNGMIVGRCVQDSEGQYSYCPIEQP